MLMFVRPSVSNLSRAVNLHLSRSESTQSNQRAVSEHSVSIQWIKIRVFQSEPINTTSCFKTIDWHLGDTKISWRWRLSVYLCIYYKKKSHSFVDKRKQLSIFLYLVHVRLR